MISCLLITYNRLAYSKRAFEALLKTGCRIIIIDNGSEPDTIEWLVNEACWEDNVKIIFNEENQGIAGAMNKFFELTAGEKYVAKSDNDTICPPGIWEVLTAQCERSKIDIIQAAHKIDPAVWPATGTFEGFISSMKKDKYDPRIHYHHFVGGSGIVMRRDKLGIITATEWALYGWRQYQREHPELVKAFSTAVQIELLDGGGRYEDYPEYYKQTKRLK